MKNTILLVAMLLLLTFNLYSFEKVNTLDLNNLDYSKVEQMRIKIKFKGRVIATHNAVELNKILKLNQNEFAEIYFQEGDKVIYSHYDLSELNNQNPLLLIDNKNVSSLGDTLVIGEGELLNLGNNTLLETELNSIIDVQYQLNLKKLTQMDIKNYFKPSSIIYPFDNSINRWKSKIEKIIIYKNS